MPEIEQYSFNFDDGSWVFGGETMPETLLSSSNILLYGRVLTDLTVVHDPNQEQRAEEEIHRPLAAPRVGATNTFLDTQLQNEDSRLARIYGFSFEGHYFDLAKPALFMVHGPGMDVGPDLHTDRTGVAAQEHTFSADIMVWSYDKGDFSIRLDVQTGPFEDILLETELRADMQGTHYSGAEARIRTSGAEARIRTSGAEARSRNRGGS
jgi:hypothetical protein